jgi:hypothetical protein
MERTAVPVIPADGQPVRLVDRHEEWPGRDAADLEPVVERIAAAVGGVGDPLAAALAADPQRARLGVVGVDQEGTASTRLSPPP